MSSFYIMVVDRLKIKPVCVIAAAVLAAAVALVAWVSGGLDALYMYLVSGWGRMEHMVLSRDMWMLILGGLKNTVIIFVFAAIVAILLGSFLAYLSISRRWPWFHNPLRWIVEK